MSLSLSTRDQAKARAREIRADLAKAGTPISHSEALEWVAKELGYRDWNTASARLSNMPEVVLQVGDQVAGRYLKQAFDGRVLAVREMAGGTAFEVTLEFDEPVDVVEFDSFSNFRQRITTTVSSGGVSFSKTSDGVPHLTVERTSIGLV
ncbi:glyoxalase superfamily protein [Hyphomonas adhaerens]|nr:glyoxalase superfamily protein [Hyphomonas adhaerens]